MQFLRFTLSGIRSAWGLPLPGNTRMTRDHPSKSGITGFIGACHGITNLMEKEYVELSQFGFACREDVPGSISKDFHTVRVGPGIVSERFYLMGAVFTVCLWETKDCPYKLKDISKSLIRPHFVPFLGRKCCVLNAPPDPNLIDAENLLEAFEQYQIPEFVSPFLKEQKSNRIFWEGDDQSIEKIQSNDSFDQPTGIKKYGVRIEHVGRRFKDVSK